METYEDSSCRAGWLRQEWDSLGGGPTYAAYTFGRGGGLCADGAGGGRETEKRASASVQADMGTPYLDYRWMLEQEDLDIVCVSTQPKLCRENVVAAVGANGERTTFPEVALTVAIQLPQ